MVVTLKNPQDVNAKPGSVLCIGETALLVLPKNSNSGGLVTFVDENEKVLAQLRVIKIQKLPYPEKL